MEKGKSNISAIHWVIISAVGFLLFLIAAFLVGIYSDKLHFENSSTYFFLLIPLALVCAAFLFGALKSHAKYSGKTPSGTLELGGPVVVLALVIFLGFKFRPQEKEFSYTLNFFNAADSAEVIKDGTVELFFGTARMVKNIGEGQSVFAELPAKYKGNRAVVIAKAKGFMAKRQTVEMPFGSIAQNIFLEKKRDSVVVHGLLRGAKRKAVKNASLVFADGVVKTNTDSYGNFTVAMPFKDGDEVPLRIYINDRLAYDNLIILSNTVSLNIQLP